MRDKNEAKLASRFYLLILVYVARPVIVSATLLKLYIGLIQLVVHGDCGIAAIGLAMNFLLWVLNSCIENGASVDENQLKVQQKGR